MFAYGSLERTGEISILGNYKGHSLKRRVTRLSEASSGQIFNYDFLNPFSSKNPILIPQTPKLIYRNDYGFTKQQSIRNISYQHHQTHIIQQQWAFFMLLTLINIHHFQSNFMQSYIYIYILTKEMLAHPYLIK